MLFHETGWTSHLQKIGLDQEEPNSVKIKKISYLQETQKQQTNIKFTNLTN